MVITPLNPPVTAAFRYLLSEIADHAFLVLVLVNIAGTVENEYFNMNPHLCSATPLRKILVNLKVIF